MVEISVVVPTIGRESLIECLISIKEQSYENYEVIVTGLSKETETIVNSFGFNFLLSPVASVSKQRNLGIDNSRGNIIAFIDDDAIADKEWLSNLIKHYKDEEVASVGGKVIPRISGKIPEFLKDLPPGIFKGFIGETLLEFTSSTVIDKPLLWASNFSVRKTIFDKIGLFDEELGRSIGNLMGEEETDIQRRILKEGFKIIYEPNSIVTHLVDEERLTKLWFLERSFWQGYSEILSIRKAENFNKLLDFENLTFKYMSFIKFTEIIFELIGSNTLEKEIDKAKKLGRISALSSLIER
jgi:glycosyltransferase involved in cell wall biosynthesis